VKGLLVSDLLILSQEGTYFMAVSHEIIVTVFFEYLMKSLCAQSFFKIAREEWEMANVLQPTPVSHHFPTYLHTVRPA
jgi:hypothetical protein